MFGYKLIRESEPEKVTARQQDALDRLETVERQLRNLDADFTDLWDKVQRQVARLVKREQREDAPETQPTDSPMVQHRLTPQQAAALNAARQRGLVK